MPRSSLFQAPLAALLLSGSLASAAPSLSCPAGTRPETQVDVQLDTYRCVRGQGNERVAHGPWVTVFKNGQRNAVGQTENGHRSGLWVFFQEDGTKTEEIHFLKGDYEGSYTRFHPNGQARLVEQYRRGAREGVAREFSAEGKLVRQWQYAHDKQVVAR